MQSIMSVGSNDELLDEGVVVVVDDDDDDGVVADDDDDDRFDAKLLETVKLLVDMVN